MLSVSRRNGWTEARDRKRAGQAGTARRFVHFFRALFLFRQLPFHFSTSCCFCRWRWLKDPIAVSVASTK